MSIREEVTLLKSIPFFKDLEDSHLKLLAFTSERLEFQENQFLFEQGDQGDSAYILISGKADVIIHHNNKSQKIAEVSKNQMVGEIAVICDIPRTASVQATTPLCALRISKEFFFQLVKQFPDVSIAIMKELALRLETANKKLQN